MSYDVSPNDLVLIRTYCQLAQHTQLVFNCGEMKLGVFHILLFVRLAKSLVTIKKCCKLGEALNEWYKCESPDNERWVMIYS